MRYSAAFRTSDCVLPRYCYSLDLLPESFEFERCSKIARHRRSSGPPRSPSLRKSSRVKNVSTSDSWYPSLVKRAISLRPRLRLSNQVTNKESLSFSTRANSLRYWKPLYIFEASKRFTFDRLLFWDCRPRQQLAKELPVHFMLRKTCLQHVTITTLRLDQLLHKSKIIATKG